MDEFSMKNRNIDDKLCTEMSRLEALNGSLKHSNQMTENMMDILTSFDSRLKRLEETIMPVYQESGQLQRRHENIDRTLNLLDHVLTTYHVADEVDHIIREGPSGRLDQYLESMEKLKNAHDYFNANNSDTPEMSHVATLFDAGKDSLEREFRNLLTRQSKPVPPVGILDAIVADEENPDDEPFCIDHMPEKVVDDLQKISHWLQNCGLDTDYMQVYSSMRSACLTKSLQGLQDHLRSQSHDSTNSNFTHSPAPVSKHKSRADTPSRKEAKPKGIQILMKKASQQMQQMMIESVAKKGGVGEGRDDIMEKDIEVYATSISALLKLIQSEFKLMTGIIPIKHRWQVFEKVIQASVDGVVNEGEQIVQNTRRSVARGDYTAVLFIFPVGKHLRSVKPEFDKVLHGCPASVKQRIPGLISAFDVMGAKALQDYIDGIRNAPDKGSNMPRDGTVHEVTSNTLLFLEQLQDYAETVGAMLLSQDRSVASAMVYNEAKAKLKLAEYITKVLSALGLNLSNKAETYSDATLKSIFMMNNFNYIIKSLQKAGMLELVHKWNPDVKGYYDEQIMDQKRTYSQSWSRVLTYVLEAHNPISQQRTASPEAKLKDKERQIIKDKFTGFNTEMENLHKVQKTYAVPDPELKQVMKQDNKDFVIPKYKIFLEKYKQLNFTKNPEKYIKYSVNEIDRLIDSFFESVA